MSRVSWVAAGPAQPTTTTAGSRRQWLGSLSRGSAGQPSTGRPCPLRGPSEGVVTARWPSSRGWSRSWGQVHTGRGSVRAGSGLVSLGKRHQHGAGPQGAPWLGCPWQALPQALRLRLGRDALQPGPHAAGRTQGARPSPSSASLPAAGPLAPPLPWPTLRPTPLSALDLGSLCSRAVELWWHWDPGQRVLGQAFRDTAWWCLLLGTRRLRLQHGPRLTASHDPQTSPANPSGSWMPSTWVFWAIPCQPARMSLRSAVGAERGLVWTAQTAGLC